MILFSRISRINPVTKKADPTTIKSSAGNDYYRGDYKEAK